MTEVGISFDEDILLVG